MIGIGCLRSATTLLLGALTGCTAAFGTLHGVSWDGRAANDQERNQVRVTRAGEPQRVFAGMSLQKADQIATGPHTRVVLFLQGYEIVLDTSTAVRIENPSIFVTIGDVFAKVVERVREALTINSEFTTAAVQGTEFLFSVHRDQVVTIIVLEGQVTAQLRDGRYPPVVYGSLQRGRLRPGQPPDRMGVVSRAEAEGAVQWAREAERVIVVRVPDVRGLPLEQARAVIERAGFQVLVTGQVTGNAPPGSVIDQNPRPEQSARPGEYVRLTVESRSLVLPDVRRLPLQDAIRRLEALGLQTRVSRPERRDTVMLRARRGDSVDVVVDQSPAPGSRVAEGSRVELIVPRIVRQPPTPPDRPQEPLPPRPATCTVPDVRRLDEQAARTRLRRAGFGNVRAVYGTGKLVTMQHPQAGSSERCDTPVEIRIGQVID